MSQLEYLRKARTQMAAAIKTLSSALEHFGTCLTGKPYILSLADCQSHCLSRADGEWMVCAASDLLTDVARFNLEDAEQLAAAMVEQGESELVAVLALDWQRARLVESRQALASLDDLIAEQEPLAPAA
jgi:hypothetical protein